MLNILAYVVLGLIGLCILAFFIYKIFTSPDVWEWGIKFVVFLAGLSLVIVLILKQKDILKDDTLSIYDIVYIIIGTFFIVLIILNIVYYYTSENKINETLIFTTIYTFLSAIIYLPIYLIIKYDQKKNFIMWSTLPIILLFGLSYKLDMNVLHVIFGFSLIVYFTILLVTVSENIDNTVDYVNRFLTL